MFGGRTGLDGVFSLGLEFGSPGRIVLPGRFQVRNQGFPLVAQHPDQKSVPQIHQQKIEPLFVMGAALHGGAETGGTGIIAGQPDEDGPGPFVGPVDVMGQLVLTEDSIEQSKGPRVTGTDIEEDPLPLHARNLLENHSLRRLFVPVLSCPLVDKAHHALVLGKEKLLGREIRVLKIKNQFIYAFHRAPDQRIVPDHRGMDITVFLQRFQKSIDPCLGKYFICHGKISSLNIPIQQGFYRFTTMAHRHVCVGAIHESPV